MSTAEPIELRKTKIVYSQSLPSDEEDDESYDEKYPELRANAPAVVTAAAVKNAAFVPDQAPKSPTPAPKSPTPPPKSPPVSPAVAAVVVASTPGKKSPVPPPMKQTKKCPFDDS